MKKIQQLFWILVLVQLFLTSCGKDVPAEETQILPDTENALVAQTLASTEATSNTQNLLGDVVEWKYGFAYQSDIDKYGMTYARAFYRWRQNGNPDWMSTDISSEEYVVYHNNEGGIIFEPLQKTYSAKDRDAKWGIDVISISDGVQIMSYSDALNIDKKVDGQWVRQTILDTDRVVHSDTRAHGIQNQKVLDAVFSVSLDEIAFELEPGEYRFIFYAFVTAEKKAAYSMYYVPFEVTE